MYTWDHNTKTERSSMGRKIGVIDMALSTFDITSLAMMIRGGVVEKDHVITRTVLGMLF
jgi:hypothetical protein